MKILLNWKISNETKTSIANAARQLKCQINVANVNEMANLTKSENIKKQKNQ